MAASRLHVRLLGHFSVAPDRDFAAPLRLSGKKVTALLAFLATSPRQMADRERLACLLWGSRGDPQARHSLRQALVQLRRELQPFDVIEADANVVKLNPGAIWVDALEVEASAASTDFDALARAVELLQGEFLVGLHIDEEDFQDWLEKQRGRFSGITCGLIERYASQADQLGKGPEAIAATERLLEIDPLREDWQRLALTTYARHRGRNEALAQAKRFAQVLQRELSVEPELETLKLVGDIESGTFTQEAPPASAVASDVPKSPYLTAVPATAADALRNAATHLRKPRVNRSFPPLPALTVFAGLIITAAAALAGTMFLAKSKLGGPQTPSPVPGTAVMSDYWRSPRASTDAGPEVPATVIPMVVLPLRTYDHSPDTQLAAEMLADDLSNMLSRVGALRVISRETSRTYQTRPVNVTEIRADLKVRYVLAGNVRIRGDKLRVHLELIDAASTFVVWSTGVEGDGPDWNAVVDNIVRRLGRELAIETTILESRRRSDEIGVGQLIFKGMSAITAASVQGPESYQKAQVSFERALKLEPHNASALAGLGGVHATVAARLYTPDPAAAFAKAEAILQKALLAHPHHIAANFFMGVAKASGGNPRVGLEYFQRVVEANPSHAPAHALVGHTFARLGKHAEGLEHIRYALRLSPKDPARSMWLEFACNSELELGRLQGAIDDCSHSVALNPTYGRSWAGLAAAHALSGNAEQAGRAADKLRALEPGLPIEALMKRFGRGKVHGIKLPEGLRLALTSKS
jgi:DNA-binding SARP family transcriptional activator/TolB-like protein/Flp pilus assembly protein TadD